MRGGSVDHVPLRPIDRTTLRLRLAELSSGQEIEVALDELCAAFEIPNAPNESDLAQIRKFATDVGCELRFDEFGHYNPTFRKISG